MARNSLCLLLAVPLLALGQTVTSSGIANYKPITGDQRLKWFVRSNVGPESLLGAGVISAAWRTLWNDPPEYGSHWEGFGKRYGMRLTGVAVGNAMEASLGAIWGEDPRYFRAEGRGFGGRVKHVIGATFVAPGPDGRYRPAYARYAAAVGGNSLSSTWRVPSQDTVSNALARTAYAFLGRMAGQAFQEFWPSAKKKLFRKK